MDLSRRGLIKLSASAAAARAAPAGRGEAPRAAPRPAAPAGSGGGGREYRGGTCRQGVVPQWRAGLFGFVHIASIGLAGGLAAGEMLNSDYASVEACAKTVAENADLTLGVKVRIPDSVV